MTTLLQSEPSAKSVKLLTGWGWVENLTSAGLIITVKTGFFKGKDYKEKDIDFIRAIGGALSSAESETYAIRFKDGQEIVIQEERSNNHNREALKRLSRATQGLAILASNRKRK